MDRMAIITRFSDESIWRLSLQYDPDRGYNAVGISPVWVGDEAPVFPSGTGRVVT